MGQKNFVVGIIALGLTGLLVLWEGNQGDIVAMGLGATVFVLELWTLHVLGEGR
jgi:hypothetical protein